MDPLTYEEPLGKPSDVIDIDSIQTWDIAAQLTDVSSEEVPVEHHLEKSKYWEESPFEINETINRKVAVWSGELSRLNAIAIVNSTNESMTDRNPLSERIFAKAGPELVMEIRNHVRVCKTGEAKLTKAYNLPARYVIHTVGPRYNKKYITAAESALFNCYRNLMQVVKENQIQTLGLCCVHSLRRNYPPEDGAHIALRTLRRFLEKNCDIIEKIVFVCTELEEIIYKELMPLYFPRTQEELNFSALYLPKSIGNESGEPVIEERQIRISDKPISLTKTQNSITGLENVEEAIDLDDVDDDMAIHEMLNMSVCVGKHSFAKMEADHDKERRQKVQGKTTIEAERLSGIRRYNRLVKRAKQEDLSDIVSLRCFYYSGVDKRGSPVFVFVARNFPYHEVDLQKALLYLIHVMDPLVNDRYVIIYVHTNTSRDNQPALSFLKEVYKIVDDRYKTNLKAFYLLHPPLLSKVLAWFFTTFTAPNIKNRVHMVRGVEELYSKINPDQLDVPPFVMDYDYNVNGSRYYVPPNFDTDEL